MIFKRLWIAVKIDNDLDERGSTRNNSVFLFIRWPTWKDFIATTAS